MISSRSPPCKVHRLLFLALVNFIHFCFLGTHPYQTAVSASLPSLEPCSLPFCCSSRCQTHLHPLDIQLCTSRNHEASSPCSRVVASPPLLRGPSWRMMSYSPTGHGETLFSASYMQSYRQNPRLQPRGGLAAHVDAVAETAHNKVQPHCLEGTNSVCHVDRNQQSMPAAARWPCRPC